MRPLCFVLMPFGRKPDAVGRTIDFDVVYSLLIKPAIEGAGLEPIRADEEMSGGLIHKAMFERLVLCQYAVADLTTANANVAYELGVRHASRPWSTIALISEGSRLPFDFNGLRALPYRLDAAGLPTRPQEDSEALKQRLIAAREAHHDSPVFSLVEDMQEQPLKHEKTDLFRERVVYAENWKRELARARKGGVAAIKQVEAQLGPITDLEAGVAIDLLLSYRAVKAWKEMIALDEQFSMPLRSTVMVREQLGFALNRAGRSEEAERVLLDVIRDHGPSSETYGILGRVFKDRWEAAAKSDEDATLAPGLLRRAIDAYLKGFEADWRDAYPGVNAVTLMELAEPPDERRLRLLPVVTYAVERKVAVGQPDYWDHATLLELAVLQRHEADAQRALEDALAVIREVWEPETTARNLRLIRDARARRGDVLPWAIRLEEALTKRAARGT